MYVSNEVECTVTFKAACELALKTVESQLVSPESEDDIGKLNALKEILLSTIADGAHTLDQPVVMDSGQNPGFTPLYYALEEKGIFFISSGSSPTTIFFSFSS